MQVVAKNAIMQKYCNIYLKGTRLAVENTIFMMHENKYRAQQHPIREKTNINIDHGETFYGHYVAQATEI